MNAVELLNGKFKDFGLITGVPCSYFKGMINAAINDGRYLPATDEGAAVAIATGYQIASGKPALVLMQNSGIGNAISPLTSLNAIFREPITMMVSQRGGENDEPQHELMGMIDELLLNTCNVLTRPVQRLEMDMDKEYIANQDTKCLAYLVPKGTFEPVELKATMPEERRHKSVWFDDTSGKYEGTRQVTKPSTLHSKYEFIQKIVEKAKASFKKYVIIATTGYTGRELWSIEDADNNLYMVGSMGCASALGLGMALGDPELKVIILDGDGAILMRPGAMATIGSVQPDNLIHICFNNGLYDTTGGQFTGCWNTSFGDLAMGFGYSNVMVTDSFKTIERLDEQSGGPIFMEIAVCPGHEKVGRPTLKPYEVKERLINYIRNTK